MNNEIRNILENIFYKVFGFDFEMEINISIWKLR